MKLKRIFYKSWLILLFCLYWLADFFFGDMDEGWKDK